MSAAIIIPSRYGSTRLPGKPLHLIAGRSMVERVWSLACAVPNAARVIVATDDERIADHVRAFGGEAVLTPPECENGTERTLAAVGTLADPPEIVVNLQGDAVLTPPWIMEALIAEMEADPAVALATPAVRMTRQAYEKLREAKANGEVGGTTVVFDRQRNALYFSKAIIPYVRNPIDPLPVFRHIGLYAYRFDALRRYVALGPSPLERIEGLEQLRALENGIPVRIVEVDYRGRTHWAVDSAEDLLRVEEIIGNEGELVLP